MSDPPGTWSLAAGYTVRRFSPGDHVTAERVFELWTDEAALDAGEARRRLSEILLVIFDAQDALAGVSTAYLARDERLRAELWHIRMYVAEAHRKHRFSAEMSRIVVECLTHRYVSGEDRRGIGILYEIESEVFKRWLNQGITPAGKFAFIGVDDAGRDIRVRYFPGALAPEPG